jgi:uncharacterized protein YhbP (UPF0306 family)
MKTAEELIREYLPMVNVMQLATSVGNQPWLCTVHFYNDDDFNLYWISTPERRHSQEIAHNNKVAAYMLVHENTPEEDYVIGISIEGTAELIGQEVDGVIDKAYAKKQDKDPQLMADIKSGKNPHRFYKFTPTKFVIFDTKNIKGNPRQEWSLKG